MTADAPAGDREAELLAVRAVALAGVEIEPGSPEPADREIFERVPDVENAQRLAGELLAFVLRRARELELQRALAGVSEARAAEIGLAADRRGVPLSIAASMTALIRSASWGDGCSRASERHLRARRPAAMACMASWKPPTATSMSVQHLRFREIGEPRLPADLLHDLGDRLHRRRGWPPSPVR